MSVWNAALERRGVWIPIQERHAELPAMPRHPSFTLVELLVVIGILAILIAILAPALAMGQAMARKINCASNIRQIGLGVDSYANDHGEALPLACEDELGSNLSRWFGRRSTLDAPFAPETGCLAPYLGGRQAVTACPSISPYRGAAWNNSFEKGCGGFGYNWYFLGSSCWRMGYSAEALRTFSRRTEFASPWGTVSFCDTGFARSGHIIEYSKIELPWQAFDPPYDARSGGSRWDPTIHFRHMGRCNVLFLDGHVEEHPMSFTSPVYASDGSVDPSAFKLGWFGPDDYTWFDQR